MSEKYKVQPNDLIGVYSEMAELIGLEAVTKIYIHFKGQQIAFPTRLYTKDYIVRQLNTGEDQPMGKIATKYGYSERRLRQILKLMSRKMRCQWCLPRLNDLGRGGVHHGK